jgi:transposase
MDAGRPSYDELLELVAQLRQQVGQLQAELVELRSRNVSLEEELAEAKRTAARQAAPFRRREKLKTPDGEKKKPGQKPGHTGYYREPPREVDETLEVPLPCCPHCQAPLEDIRRLEQVIEELPGFRPLRYKIITHEGVCRKHGPVRSTHPLQTSTAVGAAGTHLGPRAQATAVALSHRSGLSVRKVCETLQTFFGLSLSPGGLSQLLARAADRTEHWYDEIVACVRSSAAVFADETSWYVGQPGWWLWDFTTDKATLYVVSQSRGSDVVQDVLGSDFQGILVTDCLASYNAIDCRKHKCIAHHLRALKEQEEALEKRGRSSLYLTSWKLHLKDVIATWNNRAAMSPAAWTRKVEQLKRGVDNLLDKSPAEPEEVRFRNRLERQRPHLLGCLEDPAAEPTNNRAERDLRPAVISRKISCGNKTVSGKTTWERLRSLSVTAAKEGVDLVAALACRLALAPQSGRVAR